MSTSAINNNSAYNSFFETNIASNGNNPKTSTSDTQLSTFAQLLGTSASSTASSNMTGNTSKTNSPNQMMTSLMASFKNEGIQNEGSSEDPMSIG